MFWLKQRLQAWHHQRAEKLQKEIERVKELEEAEAERQLQLLLRSEKVRLILEERVFKEALLWRRSVFFKLLQEIKVCERCLEPFGFGGMAATLDHIIPQSIIKDLGIDADKERDERNIRLLHRLCNSKKGHSLDFSDYRTKPLLLEYLARVSGAEKLPPRPVSQVEKYNQKLTKRQELQKAREIQANESLDEFLKRP